MKTGNEISERSESFPPSTTKHWRHHHILDLDDFTREEIELVFETADAMSEILTREVKQVPTLRGKTIINLFYEASTRTRSSFDLAAKNLSASTINLDPAKSSISKGESLINSLLTLQALGADIIVIRHSQSGAPYLAARHTNISIVNGGDGAHAHPSQALLDLYTIRRHLGKLDGLKVAIIGDIMHSRVARSNIWGMNTMGMKLVLCAPPTLQSVGMKEYIRNCNLADISLESDIKNALTEADVVMALRLQLERQQSGLLPTLREYAQLYQVNTQRLQYAKPDAFIMHPGPMNEGIEISPEVAHGSRSVVEEQVANGVAIRMALFYLLAGGRSR